MNYPWMALKRLLPNSCKKINGRTFFVQGAKNQPCKESWYYYIQLAKELQALHF